MLYCHKTYNMETYIISLVVVPHFLSGRAYLTFVKIQDNLEWKVRNRKQDNLVYFPQWEDNHIRKKVAALGKLCMTVVVFWRPQAALGPSFFWGRRPHNKKSRVTQTEAVCALMPGVMRNEVIMGFLGSFFCFLDRLFFFFFLAPGWSIVCLLSFFLYQISSYPSLAGVSR